MPLQKYKIEFSDIAWDMEVVVDTDTITTWEKKDKSKFTVLEIIKEMVEFWTDWGTNLEYNDGDYTMTFLQNLGRECVSILATHNYSLFGLVSEFEDKEGWCKMDGSCGIKIVQCDDVNLPNSSFVVTKQQGDA